MSCFDKIVEHTLEWEGGLVNDPDDLGGLTNRGITLKFFSTFCREVGYFPASPLRQILIHMDRNEAVQIYHDTFWNWIQGDKIKNCTVALAIFDFFVNADQLRIRKGVRKSIVIRTVQKIIKVTVDGVMGPKTIEALNNYNQKNIFDHLQEERKNYYLAIIEKRPRNKKFLRGWLKRMDSIQFED